MRNRQKTTSREISQKSQLAFFSKFVKKNTSTFMEQGHLSENEVNGYHFVNRHFRFSPEEFSF